MQAKINAKIVIKNVSIDWNGQFSGTTIKAEIHPLNKASQTPMTVVISTDISPEITKELKKILGEISISSLTDEDKI